MSLPKPKRRQKDVLYLPGKGHCVVLGTAGSGKTTLAILRAAYLQSLEKDPNNRTLLVTFNNMLVTYLKSIAAPELKHVDVRTYHHFARGYLSNRGKMGRYSILDEDDRVKLIDMAMKHLKTKYGAISTLKRDSTVFAEEIQWIGRSGINSLDVYKKVERKGRQGTRIARKERHIFWEVYELYLNYRNKMNKDYDWDDVAQMVISEFKGDGTPRMYKHVIIDEGQDFSPVMLKSLALAIPTDGSLTFFGDMAQQIYGTRITWRSAGLHPPKVWEFQENYRNTKQIARFAIAMTEMPYFKGVPDLVEPSEPKADGPLPTIVECNNVKNETEFSINQAKEFGRTQSVALLLRDRKKESIYIDKLQKEGFHVVKLHRKTGMWRNDPCIYVGTYHSAKGLEFDGVILPHCNDETLPDKKRIRALESEEEAMAEEGQLLYVAITRPRTRLIIIYSGNITKLLPINPTLFQKVKL